MAYTSEHHKFNNDCDSSLNPAAMIEYLQLEKANTEVVRSQASASTFFCKFFISDVACSLVEAEAFAPGLLVNHGDVAAQQGRAPAT
jgi:hypothetical protein